MKREEQWLANYERLKAYIALYHQLPAKTRVENRGLLNWWKYNKRLAEFFPTRDFLVKHLRGACNDHIPASIY